MATHTLTNTRARLGDLNVLVGAEGRGGEAADGEARCHRGRTELGRRNRLKSLEGVHFVCEADWSWFVCVRDKLQKSPTQEPETRNIKQARAAVRSYSGELQRCKPHKADIPRARITMPLCPSAPDSQRVR